MDNTKRFGMPPISETLNMSKRSRRELLKEAIELAVFRGMDAEAMEAVRPFENSIDLFLDVQSSDWFYAIDPIVPIDPLGLARRFREVIGEEDESRFYLGVHPSTIGSTVLIYDRENPGAPYERIELDGANPILVTLSGLCAGLDITLRQQRLRYPEPSKFWAYHPERLRCSCRHVHEFDHIKDAAALRNRWNVVFDNEYVYWLRLKGSTFKERVTSIASHRDLEIPYKRFDVSGRHIYYMDRDLTELLANSDIDDVPFEQLKLPHAAFYIHFGPQEAISFENGVSVDGCYVTDFEDGIEIAFVFDNSLNIDGTDWVNGSDPFIAISLSPEDTIGSSISAESRFFDSLIVKADYLIKHEEDCRKSRIKSLRAAHYEARSLRDQSQMRAALGNNLKDALRLAVNSILYISSYGDEVQLEVPEDAPSRARAQFAAADKEGQAKIARRLVNDGFVVVNHVKSGSAEHLADADPAGSRRSHWRRGFWRMQRIGKGWSDARLTWVRPTIVSGHNAPADRHGVIHRVT